MTMKLSRKLLAAVLVLAVCITTVFSCLITVFAAEDYVTFGEGSTSSDMTTATIDATFTAGSDFDGGIYAGLFTLNVTDQPDDDTYLTLASVVSKTDGFEVSVQGSDDAEFDLELPQRIVFESDTGATSVTLTFNFNVNGKLKKGDSFDISLTNIALSDRYSDYDGNTATGTISSGCVHVVTYDASTLLATDETNGYAVYEKSYCTLCGEQFGYQVAPVGEVKMELPDDRAILYWDGTYDTTLADNGETGENWENAIIIDSAAELAHMALDADTETEGKYYKLAEGIKAIVLQKETHVTEVMSFESTSTIASTIAGYSDKLEWSYTYNDRNFAFRGKFDGNGVAIYGMYASGNYYSGLFPQVASGFEIRNVAVRNSAVEGVDFAGGVVGRVLSTTTANGIITLENIEISNCEIIRTYENESLDRLGIIIASSNSNNTGLVLNNIFAYNNTATLYNGTVAGIFGAPSNISPDNETATNYNQYSNMIILGSVPYSTYQNSGNAVEAANFENVYTDTRTSDPYSITVGWRTWADFENRIYTISADDVKGPSAVANFPSFGWTTNGGVWAAGAAGEYPSFYVEKVYETIKDKSETLYWDGEIATAIAEGTGTEADPYIINTAAELALAVTESNGSYYKVADNVGKIVLQESTNASAIMNITSGDDAKTVFSGLTGLHSWRTSNDGTFNGHFDGNGVQIYGLYTKDISTNYNVTSALFPKATAGSSFKNFAIKNSFVQRFAAVSAVVASLEGSGVVIFENVEISNNYLATTRFASGYVAVLTCGGTSVGLDYSNLLIYGNATYACVGTASSESTLTATGSYIAQYAYNSAETETQYNDYTNSIILDCNPVVYCNGNASVPANFTNVYINVDITDMDTGTAYEGWNLDWSTTITVISADDVKGEAAATTCAALDWSDLWMTTDGYPTFKFMFDPIGDTADSDLTLSAINLTYNTNGSVNVNFYYIPNDATVVPDMYVPDLSGASNKFIKLTPDYSANIPDGLDASTLVYSIKNISATRIGDLLLPTAVYNNYKGSIAWGKTENTSIKDYAMAVISGDGVYYAGQVKSEEVALDKNIAAAVVNYGTTAIDALGTKYNGNSSSQTENVIYFSGAPAASIDDDGAGTEDDPIIIETVEELYYLTSVATSDVTSGKYYKFADGIDVIVPHLESDVSLATIKGWSTPEEVKEGILSASEAGKARNWWNGNDGAGAFAGTIDFNGITVYGLYGKGGALIPNTVAGATIKNLSIKNSYLVGSNKAGAVVGDISGSGSVTFENVTVANNYIYSSSTGTDGRAGTLVAGGGSAGIIVNNCLVYGNTSLVLEVATGLHGNLVNNASYTSISNSIILGCVPYGTYSNGANTMLPTNFTNVYTDTIDPLPYTVTGVSWDYTWASYTDHITEIATKDAMGANAVTVCSALDWNSVWCYGYGNDYPTITLTDAVAKTDTIYLDSSGTVTSPIVASDTEDGTEAKPYIIDTMAEFYYMLRTTTAAETTGVYFKLAENIGTIVCQTETYATTNKVTADMTAEDAMTLLTGTSSGRMSWWNTSTFDGTLDLNGAVIYGAYSTNGGLFGTLGANATIKNFTVKNSYAAAANAGLAVTAKVGAKIENVAVEDSYFTATNKAGALAADLSGTGAVYFTNCIVADNYLHTTATNTDGRIGVLVGGGGSAGIMVDGCLVYGNTATSMESNVLTAAGLHANIANNAPGTDADCTQISNSIILGCTPYGTYPNGANVMTPGNFTNVYTDTIDPLPWTVRGVSWGYTWANYTGITVISADDVIGSAAITNCPYFGWAANGGVWYAGNEFDGYPSLTPAGNMPTATQTAYDAMTLTTYDSYGDSTDEFGVYATSLNLKTNPYIAFTFAFKDAAGFDEAAAAIRETITVKFTTESGTEITTVVGTNGWTHNEGAGRYHLYRLTDIPVNDLTGAIKVEVTYGETTYDFGSYSVEGFTLDLYKANRIDPCTYYTTRIDAAKALLFYVQMVNARYGK